MKLIKQYSGLLDLYKAEKEKNKKDERRIYGAGYQNGCNDTAVWNDKHYISKDKIKAKIEELRKKTSNVVTDEINEIIIKVLQELLKGSEEK